MLSLGFKYKPSTLAVLFVLLTLLPLPKSLSQVDLAGIAFTAGSGALKGFALDAILDDIENRLHALVGNATESGSYLSEKAAREMLMVMTGVRQQFSDELETNFESLHDTTAATTLALRQEALNIENIGNAILTIPDFAYMSTQSVLNRIPFIEDAYIMTKIDGYGQRYKEKGSYTYKLYGNAFQFGNVVTARINNKDVSAAQIEIRKANELRINVSAE